MMRRSWLSSSMMGGRMSAVPPMRMERMRRRVAAMASVRERRWHRYWKKQTMG